MPSGCFGLSSPVEFSVRQQGVIRFLPFLAEPAFYVVRHPRLGVRVSTLRGFVTSSIAPAIGIAFCTGGSSVKLSGGSFARLCAVDSEGGEVNVLGGTVGPFFEAFQGSKVTVFGGSLGSDFDANCGSEVSILDGSIGDRFTANAGSQLRISGGSFGSLLVHDGAEVNFIGKEFLLSGQPIAELRKPGETLVLAPVGGNY